MTAKQRKGLATARLALSVLAVILAGVMVFSGVMYVRTAPAPEEPPVETMSLPDCKGNHSWAEGVCSNCGLPCGHDRENDSSVEYPATCTEQGYTEYFCEICGSSYKANYTDPDPQAHASDMEDNCEIPPVCKYCGELIHEPREHAFDDDEDLECNLCGMLFAIEEGRKIPQVLTVFPPVPTEAPENGEPSVPVVPTDPVAPSESVEPEPSESVIPSEPVESAPVQPAPSESSGGGSSGIKEGEKADPRALWATIFLVSAGLLVADLIAIVVLSIRIHEEVKKDRERKRRRAAPDSFGPTVQEQPRVTVGTVHQIGGRAYQQDSLGQTALPGGGILAVVADGMGGLSGGEKVSQQIVMEALSMGHGLTMPQNGVLVQMLNRINDSVNRMLGPDGLYKSGSTVVAVLAHNNAFQWISVGDSRIYLYRKGYASQINRDHDQMQVWMADVLAGRMTYEEVLRNPDSRKLTSFIGMGKLAYVDASHTPIDIEPGDRIVLMSDGIYSVVNENYLAAILKKYPDVTQAATAIEIAVREARNPHQDNYTAIVLGF